MPPIINVRNLSKEYVTYKRGDSLLETFKSLLFRDKVIVQAVKNISFTIEEAEIVGLLGENGAGKSTTIKMLSGVLYPTSGHINVMGYEPFSQRGTPLFMGGLMPGQSSKRGKASVR